MHYCVANMPGAVPRTSTFALNNATLPFLLALANKGWRQACADDAHLRAGLNACRKVTCAAVAQAQGARIRRRKTRCWFERLLDYWAGAIRSEALFDPEPPFRH